MAFIDDEGRRVREELPLEGARAAIAENMTISKRDYPQGTGSAQLDITKLIEFRNEVNEKLKDSGKKITFGDLYVKVAACALEENMELNGSRQNGKLIYYDDINISVAATLIDDQHPFLNPPQAAIFGISRNRKLPVYNDAGEIVPANLTLFSLTIDHGFADGVNVAKFLTSVNKVLQDPWTYMYHKAAPKEELLHQAFLCPRWAMETISQLFWLC